jgi:hypothetical protein
VVQVVHQEIQDSGSSYGLWKWYIRKFRKVQELAVQVVHQEQMDKRCSTSGVMEV